MTVISPLVVISSYASFCIKIRIEINEVAYLSVIHNGKSQQWQRKKINDAQLLGSIENRSPAY